MNESKQPEIITNQRGDCPFSFRCPEDWEVRAMPVSDGARFFLRGPLDPSGCLHTSIAVRAWSGENPTLRQRVTEWVKRRSAFRTFQLLTRTETSVADTEAIRVDAIHNMPLPPNIPRPEMVSVRERVIFALCNERAYQFTYRAIETIFFVHLPAFESLVTSFSPGR
jgi:hypothetical protein